MAAIQTNPYQLAMQNYGPQQEQFGRDQNAYQQQLGQYNTDMTAWNAGAPSQVWNPDPQGSVPTAWDFETGGAAGQEGSGVTAWSPGGFFGMSQDTRGPQPTAPTQPTAPMAPQSTSSFSNFFAAHPSQQRFATQGGYRQGTGNPYGQLYTGLAGGHSPAGGTQ